ncbi:MAG TPA: hypothetical protein VH475_21150 [Tepidisphaeraceae bacterium]|jgi:hypothetical protein
MSDDADKGGRPELFCPNCGYNLRGTASDRCPECGVEIDRAKLAHSRIAWEHRRSIGRFRAYWRTVAVFTFRPARTVRGSAAVAYRDAVRFRLITTLLAYVPLVLLLLAAWRWGGRMVEPPGTILSGDLWYPLKRWAMWAATPFVEGGVSLAITAVGGLLGMIAMTGVAGYFFESRAVTLAQYTCAPLAWTPATVGLLVVAYGTRMLLARYGGPWRYTTPLVMGGWIAILTQLAVWWLTMLLVLRVALRAGPTRLVVCGVFAPLIGVAVLVLTVAVMQGVIGFLVAVVVSLFRV